jgi:hypothetical protein
MENSHNGNIVVFLYPTPNSLNEWSRLYKNAGFIICIKTKMNKNRIMDTNGLLFLANVLNIYIRNIIIINNN